MKATASWRASHPKRPADPRLLVDRPESYNMRKQIDLGRKEVSGPPACGTGRRVVR